MTLETVFDVQGWGFDYDTDNGIYLSKSFGPVTFTPLQAGIEYIIKWDGKVYYCTSYEAKSTTEVESAIFVGNIGLYEQYEDTGEPFLVSSDNGNYFIATSDGGETHNITIYREIVEDLKVVLKDWDGNDAFFEGVNAVKLNTEDGIGQIFSKGEAVPNQIALDFSDGDMVVAEENKLFSRVTISKPETLLPDNIAKDVEIAGVVGTHEGVGGLIDYVNDKYYCQTAGYYQYADLIGIRSVTFKYLQTLDKLCFSGCSDLEKVDLYVASSFAISAFRDCPSLKTLIIRTETMAFLSSVSGNLFGGSTPEALSIYVPSTLVETYKADSAWSEFADRFRAIEDYPDICG